MSRWTNHVARWKDCRRCPLCEGRTKVVLARGEVPCDVLFVGEAPGENEDLDGSPFVGPAGHLLDAIISNAWPKSSVDRPDPPRLAWTNLVACFPAEEKRNGVNEPPDEAIKACAPRLVEFIELADPRLIVCVGSLARDWLDPKLKPSPYVTLSDVTLLIPQVAIVHPTAILKSPVAAQGLMRRKAEVTLSRAVEEHLCRS